MQHRGTFGYGKNRPNQAALFSICFFGGLAFLSAIALLVCGLVIARPAIWAQEFQVPEALLLKKSDYRCGRTQRVRPRLKRHQMAILRIRFIEN